MRTLHTARSSATASRRGAALLLSLLILLVLVAIVFQINISVGTDARVARNDVGQTTMDLAVESALLQVYDQLKQDGEAAGSGTGAPAGGPAGAGAADPSAAAAGGAPAAAGGAAAGGSQATDSRRDDWAMPQRTDINEIKLKILVQDEDSKLNVLNLLNPDEKEAEAAFERVVRCLDLCRDGTNADIDTRTAEQMTRVMLEFMQRRNLSKIPRPELLSDDAQNEEQGLPQSLREFVVMAPFDESHFRDYRDENGEIVHSIGSFLTVWSSPQTGSEASSTTSGGAGVGTPGAAGSGNAGGANNRPPGSSGSGGSGAANGSGAAQAGGGGSSNASSGAQGSGASSGANASGNAPQAAAGGAPGAAGAAATQSDGYKVNVNTAPTAVLKALFDDRELHPRFWDRVIEYRNLEEEKEEGEEEEEEELPQLDEYGNEIIKRRIFDSVAELSEVDGYHNLPVEAQSKLNLLLSTQSNVFTITVVARRVTSAEGDQSELLGSEGGRQRDEPQGDSLMRVVRSVVWRHGVEEEIELTPLVRWELVDYTPYEVLDYPDEER